VFEFELELIFASAYFVWFIYPCWSHD